MVYQTNSDSAFITGKTHRVCQDYARSDPSGQYTLVSDGCSASADSDFGARLLLKCVEQNLNNPSIALQEALDASRLLHLPAESLDATVLIARHVIEEGSIQVSVYGDGIVAAIDDCGEIEAFHIEYPSGYPQYLSYNLSEDRRNRLKELTDGNKCIITKYKIKDKISIKEDFEDQITSIDTTFTFLTQKYNLVAIFSDGANTFTDSNRVSIPWQTIVAEMMNITARKGEFIQRQMNWLVKETAKRKWYHDDDFSMGAINILPLEQLC